jgi:hypothetical protein
MSFPFWVYSAAMELTGFSGMLVEQKGRISVSGFSSAANLIVCGNEVQITNAASQLKVYRLPLRRVQ